MAEGPRRKGDTRMSRSSDHRRGGKQSARRVAYEVLRDVVERDAYGNLALQQRMNDVVLSPSDAGFATELVSGTLRMQGLYNRIIEFATKRSIDDLDSQVVTVLQLGAHQLLALETPPHAAVNEQVKLAQQVVGNRVTGFVNGVLRTISRATASQWLQRVAAEASNELERLALIHSHPRWVVDALDEALQARGRGDELEGTLRANNEAPAVQLAVLRGQDQMRMDPSGISPIGYALQGGHPAQAIRELRDSGVTAKVQDQGSQVAALALVHASPISPGEQWLDLCAGPGGKTAVLASEAIRVGALVRANEIAPHRARLVEASVRGFEDVVDVVSFDGRKPAAYDETMYDRILIDAPCSGLGALRRRPEARWRKSPADIPELGHIQRDLLAEAVKHLKPGGVLAYVTCSPHLSETRHVVEWFTASHAEVQLLPTSRIMNRFTREPVTQEAESTVQLWPHLHGTDAMFIALFERRA